jgi:hypothetical protein
MHQQQQQQQHHQQMFSAGRRLLVTVAPSHAAFYGSHACNLKPNQHAWQPVSQRLTQSMPCSKEAHRTHAGACMQ